MEPTTQPSKINQHVKALIILAVLIALLTGTYSWQKTHPDTQEPTANENQPGTEVKAPNLMTAAELKQSLGSMPTDVLIALKNGNYATLATYVHPDKGLLFSPYAYAAEKGNRTLSTTQVSKLPQDKVIHLWGEYDGSGDPMTLTNEEYMKKFVYSKDFLTAPQVGYNTRIGQGNSLEGIQEAFPGAAFVEYHFPGFDSQYEGMDWQSLRLVFELSQDKWYLVGLVHDQWTI